MTLEHEARIINRKQTIKAQITYLCQQHGYCLNLWSEIAQKRYYELSRELQEIENIDHLHCPR